MPKQTSTPLDREALREEVFHQNVRRLLLFVKFAIPVFAGHILFFVIKLPEPGGHEFTWRLGIIACHGLLLAASLLMWLLAFLYRRGRLARRELLNGAFHAYILWLILAGVAIVVLDQMVTSAITPFLVVTITVAVAFYLHPSRSLPLFVIAYVLFFLLLPLTQDDPDILLSNRVNAFTVTGLGIFLSINFWRHYVDRFRQAKIIQRQSEVLNDRNQELLRQGRKMKTAIAARDQFFSIIAHDLKTPFHSLLGFSEILHNEWDEMDDREKQEIVQLIKDSSEGAYQLLLNLLDWARLQKQRMEMQPIPINIRSLVEGVLLQLNAQSTLKDIRFQVGIPSDLSVWGDDHMLTSVFRNLISNAIKFSSKGNEVRIAARKRKKTVLVSVEDQGVGISEQEQARIFRLSQSRPGTDNEKGTGLGLHLCREFVRKHKGRIWLRSKEREGTTFYICLPVSEPPF
jgi:signal transduction histidine kinase